MQNPSYLIFLCWGVYRIVLHGWSFCGGHKMHLYTLDSKQNQMQRQGFWLNGLDNYYLNNQDFLICNRNIPKKKKKSNWNLKQKQSVCINAYVGKSIQICSFLERQGEYIERWNYTEKEKNKGKRKGLAVFGWNLWPLYLEDWPI